MSKISLTDFFKFFDNNNVNQREAVVLLESIMPKTLLTDESAWVKLYRKKPEPPPAPSWSITKDQLAAIWKCDPNLITNYEIDELNLCLAKYEITTPQRIRHFLSQTAHESGGGRYKKELASGAAYEFREDLQNDEVGDGPKYKGAGYIQLTGKYNYSRLSAYLDDPQVMNGVDYVAENYPFTSAGYWWMDNRMNEFIDDGADVIAVTKRVNGGTNGLADRQQYYDTCMEVI